MQPRDGRAGLAQLEARLEAFHEYAELVRAQEAAVEEGDIDLIQELAARREVLQQRLDVGGDLEPVADDPEVPTEGPPQLTVTDGGVTERKNAADRAAEIREETYRVLLETAQTHERLTTRLTELRDDVREDATGMGRRQSGIRSYMGRKGESKRGLNLRF